MFNRLYQFYSERLVSLSLFQKVAAVFVLFALIPLFIMAPLFFRSAERIIFNETVNSDYRALGQTATIINNDFLSNQSALSTLTSIPDVINILSADPKQLGIYEQSLDLRNLLGYVNLVNTTESVFKTRLFVRDELFYSVEAVNTFPLSTIESQPWFEEVKRLPYVYIPTHTQEYLLFVTHDVVSLATGIRDYTRNNRLIGVAIADISEDWLQNILSENVTPSDNAMCIMDSAGTIIAMSGSMRAMVLPQEAGYKQEIIARFPGSQGIKTGRYKGWYVNWTPLEVHDWYLVEMVPSDKMNHGRRTLFWQMLMVMAPVVLLIILVTLLLSRSFTNTVKSMTETVQRYSDGDVNARLLVSSGDVIGRLQNCINLLFERMNRLMDERYELGQQAKHADLNALQSQINPHFLYNTLDMLYWMAKGGEHEELPRIITSLSGFYRKSLAKGRDVVTVKDEIDHVCYYIEIQNKRYNDAIHVVWSVDDTLLGCPIMKLLLQPIVENAIMHGLMKSERKGGTLNISVGRGGDDMLITIADDGIGMTHKQIHELLSGVELKKQQNAVHGYGVGNVQHRIHIFYGEPYGLTYESTIGSGTTVRILLPLDGGPSHS